MVIGIRVNDKSAIQDAQGAIVQSQAGHVAGEFRRSARVRDEIRAFVEDLPEQLTTQ